MATVVGAGVLALGLGAGCRVAPAGGWEWGGERAGVRGGGGGVCGGGGRLLVSCLCVVRRVATPRKAERSEAFHDSKYLLSR